SKSCFSLSAGFVKNIVCPTNVREHCVQCTPGQEYVDHANDLDECLRCASCDRIFGLQIAKKCIPTQNTECTCAENYFCNSSGSCTHCDPCSTCGSNLIEKHCTPTSDTICKIKGYSTAFLGVILLLLECTEGICFVLDFQIDLCCIVSDMKKRKHHFSFLLTLPDIDLSTHIPDIVGEMTLQEVKTFVRNHEVPEPVIDEILRDNANSTSEQKIKLFQDWHQRHGIKGAYETLMRSLRKLKMCSAADKIEKKLKAAIASSQEVGQSYNDNRKQSTTCTEEGGNSHLHNAEQGKTYSDHLEET
ncbi:TNR6 factor, partial [Nothoprocta ornata]|nr:TNR6 factor [Nothoprocta ornata]